MSEHDGEAAKNRHEYAILLDGNLLCIVVDLDGRCGSIESNLPRDVCPSCGFTNCCNDCDGSQGADEDAVERVQYNAYLDALESIALAHAVAGIDVGDARYVAGLETALAASTNL